MMTAFWLGFIAMFVVVMFSFDAIYWAVSDLKRKILSRFDTSPDVDELHNRHRRI